MRKSHLIRPTLGPGVGAPAFHIMEGTEIDSALEADNSALTELTAEIDSGPLATGDEKAIVLKFPRPIQPGILWLVGQFYGDYAWENWNPNPGPNPFDPFSGPVALDTRIRLFPILDFGGQTMSTLRWSNRTDLSLGSEILAPLYTQEDEYNFANVFELTSFDFEGFNQNHSQRVDLTGESDPILGLMLRTKLESVTAGLDYDVIAVRLNLPRDVPAQDANWKTWGILPNR